MLDIIAFAVNVLSSVLRAVFAYFAYKKKYPPVTPIMTVIS